MIVKRLLFVIIIYVELEDYKMGFWIFGKKKNKKADEETKVCTEEKILEKEVPEKGNNDTKIKTTTKVRF